MQSLLTDLMKHPDLDVRARAATLLSWLGRGTRDPKISAALTALFDDPDLKVRTAAASGYCDVAPSIKFEVAVSVPIAILFSSLSAPDPAVRLNALQGIETSLYLHPTALTNALNSTNLVLSLNNMLHDSAPEIRQAAARIFPWLSRIAGPGFSSRVDESLIRRLDDSRAEVREAAAAALGYQHLPTLITNLYPQVVQTALNKAVTAAFGSPNSIVRQRAFATLAPALSSPSMHLRLAALAALDNNGSVVLGFSPEGRMLGHHGEHDTGIVHMAFLSLKPLLHDPEPPLQKDLDDGLDTRPQASQLFTLGHAYFAIEEYNKAVAAYQNAIASDPINQRSYKVFLVRAYLRAGLTNQANALRAELKSTPAK